MIKPYKKTVILLYEKNFTRDRQPKMVAHHVKKWYSLHAEHDKTKLPDDLGSYASVHYVD